MTENMVSKKLFQGLNIHIMELESLRLPINNSFTPYFCSTYLELRFKRNKKFFIRNNPNLHRKLKNDLDFYLKKIIKFRFMDIILIFIAMLVTAFALGILVVISEIFDLNHLVINLISLFVAFIFIYFFLSIYLGQKRIVGEKYDEDIKKAIQELIDYGVEYVRENDLNPDDFQIKLKNNDYRGLSYEEKAKDYYIGYFKK